MLLLHFQDYFTILNSFPGISRTIIVEIYVMKLINSIAHSGKEYAVHILTALNSINH